MKYQKNILVRLGLKIIGIIMEFLLLGNAARLITPFDTTSKTAILPFAYPPTLSPLDPNFPTWWEQHKSEWEAPKKEGQEPADD